MPLDDIPSAFLARRALPLMEELAVLADIQVILDFGPIPFPADSKFPICNLSQNNRLKKIPRKKIMAACCFSLPLFYEDTKQKIFSQLCSCAGYTLFLDVKFPERNLEWPAFLLMTPLRYHLLKNYKKRMEGLEGILYKERSRFNILARRTALGGAICCILAQNIFEKN